MNNKNLNKIKKYSNGDHSVEHETDLEVASAKLNEEKAASLQIKNNKQKEPISISNFDLWGLG